MPIEMDHDENIETENEFEIGNTMNLANQIIKRHALRKKVRAITTPLEQPIEEEEPDDQQQHNEQLIDELADEVDLLHNYMLNHPRDKNKKKRLIELLDRMIQMGSISNADKMEILRTIR